MNFGQKIIKRVTDVLFSVIGLIILFPLMIYIVIKIKFDSKGYIFYLQERIGYKGRAFMIIKFRSMYKNSENSFPVLSFSKDPRVNRWGRIMRRRKLDELPQLFNVLKGEMSLVGPRPERKFFIDIGSSKGASFNYLHQFKPGLTSLGMMICGYASNITQIVNRVKYDTIYINNFSLYMDLKIIFCTLHMLLQEDYCPTSFTFGLKQSENIA